MIVVWICIFFYFSVLENKNTLNCNQPTRQTNYTFEVHSNAIKNSPCIFMLTLIFVPLLFLLLSGSNIKDLLKYLWYWRERESSGSICVYVSVFAWVHESSILDSQMLLIIFIQKYLFMQIYTSTFLTFSFKLDLDYNSFNLKKVILSEYNAT